ncbi:MAG: hypothetical protein F4X98_15085 [Gammaproteobacteria bacterium]|nr:hypothetical protein [Gammaproteobacteria bacterium]
MRKKIPGCGRSLFAAALLTLGAGCASTDVSLTLSRDAHSSNLKVVYRFSDPVDVLSFETDAGPIRSYWTPLTDGVEMRGDTAASTRGPIDQMRFAIRPDERQFDRVNPGVYVLGGGAVVNIAYLLPDSARFDHELRVVAPGATLVTDHVQTRLDATPAVVTDRTGFAYVGPDAAVHPDRNVVIVAPDAIAAPVLDVVSTLFSSAADYYAGFAEPPPLPPRIYLALDDTDSPDRAYRGTVLGNALAVYLTGDWLRTNLDAGQQRAGIGRFIRHETFHFFQGVHHSPNDDQHRSAWLWEGSAEYFAARLGAVEDADAQPTVEELGRDCLTALLDEPLVRDGTGHMGDAPYACGHFLVATAALLSEVPDGAIAAIWGAMLDPSGLHGSAWTTDEFFDVAETHGAGAELTRIANLIIDTPGLERWDHVTAMLRRSVPGIDISLPPEVLAAGEAFDLVFQLVTSHCSGASGFWNHGDSITLDASDCSGGLIDRAEVTGVESHPFGEPTAWLDTFKARCAAGEAIRFQLRDGSEMPVPCSPHRIEHP